MNKRLLIRFALIAIVALVGYFQKGKFSGGDNAQNSSPRPAAAATQSELPKLKSDIDFKSASTKSADVSSLVMKGMVIKDMDGSVAYRGNVDLAPTLARIKAGKRDSHRNDGSVFGNRERLLPQKERGYYKEYVVRTKGISHAGPQRIIMGKNGEAYYTHDHYKSFKKIN